MRPSSETNRAHFSGRNAQKLDADHTGATSVSSWFLETSGTAFGPGPGSRVDRQKKRYFPFTEWKPNANVL